MLYREDKISGNKLSALGLGCMRFPRDKAETERMILAALEGGVNFFDTAYIYPHSEKTLGEILAKHNRRRDAYIATKLPILMCKSAADFDRFFSEQLRRLKTDYIDYYFLHCVSDYVSWDNMRKLGIEEWITEKRKSGSIRRIGFSYHGSCDDFLKVLGSYAWEFCMIQYNYSDENYQAGKTGLLAAAEKNMPVIVMEPLLGGRLATGLPKRAAEIFKKADPNITPVDRAFWWLWNQPEVTVVLSGMNSKEQLLSNIRSADRFRALTETELSVYGDVAESFRESFKIPCTGCNYCLPCPKGINIPTCFSSYNASYLYGYIAGGANYVTSTGLVTRNPASARRCNGCGKCEKNCPQNIPVRKELKRVAGRFESLPIRAALALIRKFMTR